ncbi:hypothetical protein [Anoxynatronum buryatiense]|uniref:Uncharacterized protein n=1 Tax=Anoxynatronum buryatiense TaxID=489973 RepID=A0AA45WYG5_9CLOT|nr:hypothetical protein [Anoxynatronum buryatiense]SMP68640.1 hypothetical protein SAMN06296020_11736 [Anoxynatronum buryatiense]
MRITGSGKLDPDFSKIPKQQQILGIVTEAALFIPGTTEWLLPRISPRCENCGGGHPFQVSMAYRPLLGGVVPLIKLAKSHHLMCTHCGETIELEAEEYHKIKGRLQEP